jgi:hypothetical protein
MSKKSKKRNEESPNRKGGRGSESPNGKGARAANGTDLGNLLEKKLRKKTSTTGTSTPVAGAAANGIGSSDAVEALRALLDSGLSEKKSKKSSKKTCKKSKKCKDNSDDSCWE